MTGYYDKYINLIICVITVASGIFNDGKSPFCRSIILEKEVFIEGNPFFQ